jgi:hypothetical protein
MDGFWSGSCSYFLELNLEGGESVKGDDFVTLESGGGRRFNKEEDAGVYQVLREGERGSIEGQEMDGGRGPCISSPFIPSLKSHYGLSSLGPGCISFKTPGLPNPPLTHSTTLNSDLFHPHIPRRASLGTFINYNSFFINSIYFRPFVHPKKCKIYSEI